MNPGVSGTGHKNDIYIVRLKEMLNCSMQKMIQNNFTLAPFNTFQILDTVYCCLWRRRKGSGKCQVMLVQEMEI